MIQKNKIKYQQGETLLEGFYAYDDSKSGKRPLVLVAHDWSGRNEFSEQQAEKLAELGYVGFALDMYGEGKQGKTIEEKSRLMAPLKDNRALLQQRMNAALEAAKKLPQVDVNKTAAMGFCFGGLCALDLARSGADVTAVVSVHGLLSAPDTEKSAIKAKMLVLHGHDDSMCSPEQVIAFETEMTAAKIDWQLHTFSNTMHGFTNPHANDLNLGILYSPRAAKRSEKLIENFFAEVFA